MANPWYFVRASGACQVRSEHDRRAWLFHGHFRFDPVFNLDLASRQSGTTPVSPAAASHETNDNEGDTMSKILEEVLAANEQFAFSFGKGDLRLGNADVSSPRRQATRRCDAARAVGPARLW